MLLSYCVVNTNGRDLLLGCLDAIARTTPADIDHEVLVLDNASLDGSAEAVRARHEPVRLIALSRRAGKAENDSTLLREARGSYCLLLNEDAELCDGAPAALLSALEGDPRAGAAAAALLDPRGRPQPCAWRLPSVWTALAGALFLHNRLTVQSEQRAVRSPLRGGRGSQPSRDPGGLARSPGIDTTTVARPHRSCSSFGLQPPGQPGPPRQVGWAQSSAMLVRRCAAEQIGYLDPAFFVYSDETDFCKRLADRGWRTLHVPGALAVHREQLATDIDQARPRIVEFHRNRDRYIRKHHGRLAAVVVRALTSWAYLARALVALGLPGHDSRRYLLHAHQALRPSRGEGIREVAERFNRRQRLS